MRHSPNTSDSELNRLYIKDKLSTYKIATILNCDPKTVYRYLKKYHIKTRSIRKPLISKDALLDLYQNKHLSLKQIGITYHMTASGILKRMRNFNIPLRDSWEANTGKKLAFNGSLKEKAYMIGFRLGDLGIRQSSPKTKMILVGTNTTKNDQIILVKNLFKKYSKVWVSKPNKIGVMSFSTILHPSFLFLLPKSKNIEKWILLSNTNMAAFVGGYIDAEGSFGIYDKRSRFRLGSYDKEILEQIHTWLKIHKIKSIYILERQKRVGQNNDFWRITINDSKSLAVLHKLVFLYLRHSKRRSDFTKVMENINSRVQNGTIQL